jgi:hypothetical protein
VGFRLVSVAKGKIVGGIGISSVFGGKFLLACAMRNVSDLSDDSLPL